MHLSKLISSIIAVCAISACTSGTVGSLNKSDEGYTSNINYNNTMLATRLKVSDIKSRKVGDLLQVSVDLHNHWDFNLDFEYKFKFFDKDGFEVGNDSRPWTPILLTGNETASVKAIAPNPSAENFKIYVKD
jgi:uncharacterized protein YcfL